MKNKAIRKLISTAAVLCAVAIPLGACSSGQGASSASQGTSSDSNKIASVSDVMSGPEISLTFWHAMGGSNGKALETMVSDFNKQYAGKIKVKTQFQGSYDDEVNKLKSAQMAHQGPNVIQVYELGTRFMMDSGWTVPVQDFIDADKWDVGQIEPNLAAYYTVNGKLNSMPFNSSTPLLYYNKTMFKEVGLDPESPPKTFDELFAMSEKFKKTDASGKVVRHAYGMYTYGWWFDELMDKQLLPVFDNGNGRTGAPTKVLFDTNGGGAKILKVWNRLIKEGVMPSYAMNGDDANSAFVNGKLGMYVNSTAGLASMLTAVGNKFELGTGYFPSIDADSKGGVSIGGASLWIMKNDDSRVERAVWEFTKFMTSAKEQAFWNTKTGYFPITTAAYDEQVYKDNVKKYPQFKTAVDQLRDSPKESVGALCAVYTQSRKIMETNVEKMLNNQQTEEQTLTEMAKSINNAISAYNASNGK